ncbi:DUF961 family protein [Lactococcus lactis]|uniref:DUF961 family protein n=1 Tax=Lactococcus lactis TaxID=1358 RepID=UPI0024A8A1AC|nr:DUF961 family protein [Lactococcus lactis]
MSLKLSKVFEKGNTLTEELADFDRTLGKVLFLNAEKVMRFEDYMPEGEDGEIKSRPTDDIAYYEVNVYSEGLEKQISVKMPAETDFSAFEYEDEIKLTNRVLNFWNDKEYNTNGRPNYYSGQKWNAEGIEKVGKSNSKPEQSPKPETKNNEPKK